ncbi:kynurenine formamidase-like protein [Elsinoe australis]|uniref:Kynurenine formamidase n=1 Tax=Elsinoe australis TaxID=40998 RepID=A0A4U7B492_9PEZI|nr:kynurenine formamidase-like protein [Elsinoe australis]
MSSTTDDAEVLRDIKYSDKSNRNALNVCVIDKEPSQKKLWVIYIHGGAWRDPRINASSFDKTQSLLLSSNVRPRLSGLASIDYRLSPHPDFPPEHPDFPSDSAHPSRTAHHPDHINDILTAITYLQDQYKFTSNYILAGHSCGATLALQVAMSRFWSRTGPSSTPSDSSVPQPVAPISVLGLEGIYDLSALIAHNSSIPAYSDFTIGAFGPQHQAPAQGLRQVDVWANVSPTSGDYKDSTWPEGRYVLIAHSRQDELVEWEQVDLIERTFKLRGYGRWVKNHGRYSGQLGDRRFEIMELTGQHHEVWEKGDEVKRAIECAVLRTTQLPEMQ